MHNIFATLGGQGKYEEAKEMYQQTVELREKVLGKEHPVTLQAKMYKERIAAMERKREVTLLLKKYKEHIAAMQRKREQSLRGEDRNPGDGGAGSCGAVERGKK
ncbi:MAG: purine and uridine phosphorylase [Lasallia pustulata]|uniref:Purine and uridine phosphorylase n=1 Tax=Lasallia pustulata TaxID=136370 RepID=A0A5M8PQL8_9LECA|nr:MAG: purine and uridine phosphorylase [Lasallia pustulata]